MLRHAAILVLILIFFLSFTWPALSVHFSADEFQNIYQYWAAGPYKTAQAALTFWTTFNRPLGAIYYWSLYTLFHLNPFPFNVARMILMFLSVCLYYACAWQFSRSHLAAGLAAMVSAYHTEMGWLAYEGSYIFDVLCGAFYFAAFAWYLRCRTVSKYLTPGQACIFLGLYICALDSKEMAVSLPAIVFAWEFTQGFAAAGKLIKRFAPALLAIGITVVFIAGKILGKGSLTELEYYRPVLSWRLFAESSVRFMNEMFYTRGFTMPIVIAVWAVMLLFALAALTRAGNGKFLVLWVWVMTAPLPIAFIPDRGGALLFIVTAGWAMLAGLLAQALAQSIQRVKLMRRAPDWVTEGLVAALLVWVYTHETIRHHVLKAYFFQDPSIDSVVEQFRTFPVRPKPGSSVIFLHDPFEAWDTLFISSLEWNDHSLIIFLQNHSRLTSDEIAQINYVFDFKGDRLVLVRGPAG